MCAATQGFKYGLEVAVVCDEAGGLYALSNKLPPFGYPTSFATVGKGFILDPVTQSAFKLTTGEPVGPWCPSPPGIGPVIFNLISKPTKCETCAQRTVPALRPTPRPASPRSQLHSPPTRSQVPQDRRRC